MDDVEAKIEKISKAIDDVLEAARRRMNVADPVSRSLYPTEFDWTTLREREELARLVLELPRSGEVASAARERVQRKRAERLATMNEDTKNAESFGTLTVLDAKVRPDGKLDLFVGFGRHRTAYSGVMLVNVIDDVQRRRMTAVFDAAEELGSIPSRSPKLDALHPDGKCSCAGEGRCGWCARQAFPELLEDIASIRSALVSMGYVNHTRTMERVETAIGSLLEDIATTKAMLSEIEEKHAEISAERDRWAARVKLVENRIDTAIGILRGTALAAVEVFADAGCTADEIDEAIAFLDPNGNAGDVDPGDVTNHGYRVPIALAKIAAALRRRGQ